MQHVYALVSTSRSLFRITGYIVSVCGCRNVAEGHGGTGREEPKNVIDTERSDLAVVVTKL